MRYEVCLPLAALHPCYYISDPCLLRRNEWQPHLEEQSMINKLNNWTFSPFVSIPNPQCFAKEVDGDGTTLGARGALDPYDIHTWP